MNNLSSRIVNKYKKEDIFYSLEPIFQRRNEYETEENLIYVLRKILKNESTQQIHTDLIKYKKIDSETSCFLISNVHFGISLIYPSELKRAKIPLCIYLYMLNNYQKDISFNNVVNYWDVKLLNKKYSLAVELLLDKVFAYFRSKNVFKKNITADFFKENIKNYFDNLNILYDQEYNKYKITLTILSTHLYPDIMLLMEKYILLNLLDDLKIKTQNNIMHFIYNLVFSRHTYFIDTTEESVIYFLKCNYFEYRMITCKEMKIYGVIPYEKLL